MAPVNTDYRAPVTFQPAAEVPVSQPAAYVIPEPKVETGSFDWFEYGPIKLLTVAGDNKENGAVRTLAGAGGLIGGAVLFVPAVVGSIGHGLYDIVDGD